MLARTIIKLQLNMKLKKKEVKELGLEVEKLAFEIEIRKSGESLIAEFLKKSGEKFEFYDLFENFVNFYGKNK